MSKVAVVNGEKGHRKLRILGDVTTLAFAAASVYEFKTAVDGYTIASIMLHERFNPFIEQFVKMAAETVKQEATQYLELGIVNAVDAAATFVLTHRGGTKHALKSTVRFILRKDAAPAEVLRAG